MAEPFGDASKRHARLYILQRNVDIICSGVTKSGVITGKIFVGGGSQRRDFSVEIVGSGLATVDQRKIEIGEAPKILVDAQTRATEDKVGLWTMEHNTLSINEKVMKFTEEHKAIVISEICCGNRFFFHTAGDKAAALIEENMKVFTKNNGISGCPCDVRQGKIVAALFDDGSGKSWYRAKILEEHSGKVKVFFVDHGNVAVVSVASDLKPLNPALGIDRIPPVAKEAVLALIKTSKLDDDEGLEAARFLQNAAWGKTMSACIFCEFEEKIVISLFNSHSETLSVNEKMLSKGLALTVKKSVADELILKMHNSNNLVKLANNLRVAQESARKSRVGMWRYGDIGEEDEEE